MTEGTDAQSLTFIKQHDFSRATRQPDLDPLFGGARALDPFWMRLTEEMSRRTGDPAAKAEQSLQAIPNAVNHFDNWHFQRRKKVAARVNEIYSAAHFLTSRAHLLSVRTWNMAGAAKTLGNLWKRCRPFASPLECTSTGIAGALLRVAAVRSLFPMDPLDFHHLLEVGTNWYRPEDDIDNLHLMMERGAARFGLEAGLAAFDREFVALWEGREEPEELVVDESTWSGSRPVFFDKVEAAREPDPPVPFHAANELKRLLKDLVIPVLAAEGFKGKGNHLRRRSGLIETEIELQRSTDNTYEHAKFTLTMGYAVTIPRSVESVSGGFAIGRVLSTGIWNYWYDVGMPEWLRRHVVPGTTPDTERYDPNDLESVWGTLRMDLQEHLTPVLRATSTPRGLYEAATVLDMTSADKLRQVLSRLDT